MIALSFLLAVSCQTSRKPQAVPPPAPAPAIPAPDPREVGEKLFSAGKPTEARAVWSEIADPSLRDLYTSYAGAYAAFNQAVDAAERILAGAKPEEALAAVAEAGSLPSPPGAVTVETTDPLDARDRLAQVGKASAAILAARASDAERVADAGLAAANSGGLQDPAARANAAAQGYGEAERLFRQASEWAAEAAAGADRAASKAAEADRVYRSLLKKSLLSFPDRMGEVFARAPSAPDKLGDKELLAFNATTASMIKGGLSEFEKIVTEHPDLLDRTTLDRLRESARGLSARFARMESAIKAVKDRGKPVMPLIIGIFNPQPGDPQRSRPASFNGSSPGGSEWWWGIADIPSDLAQDLVITMSDSRPVRVYATGLGPGGKRPTSDLVNPLFRVGNSWPILNAGARLNAGVFHIEVGPGQSERYSGQAVVYKSFMTRTR